MGTQNTYGVTFERLIYNIRCDFLSAGQLYLDIFDTCIDVGLGSRDLLGIRFSDVNCNKRELRLIGQNTGKLRVIHLSDRVLSIIERRRVVDPNDLYLFGSNHNKPPPLFRLKKVFAGAGMRLSLKFPGDRVRNFFGAGLYRYGSYGTSIELISYILNHSSPAETLKYVGATKDEMRRSYDNGDVTL